jgi:nitrile hydratase
MGERHDRGPDPVQARVAALETLFVERGLISTDAIDAIVEAYEHQIGPHLGARVVARAWADAGYRERLLAEGTAAAAELGLGGAQMEKLVVKANEPGVHNVVVCTLCSCYPWPLLGLPPTWYKSTPYRSRMVREPRVVLSEMGLDLEDGVEIRVWDSTAEVRYLVLPERPAGTESLAEQELAALVERDHMIGVARVSFP